jgi:tetratricopeptide (TPR) repeat protein
MQTALEQIERGQYAEARTLMREALDYQRQLNEAHRNSRFTSVARTREFELNWQRVQTAQNADRIEALLLEADRAMAIDDHETALRLAGEAEALNRSILTEFPGLEPQRRQTGQRIMAMMDSAASLPLFQRQMQLHETLDHLLRTRDLPRIPDALNDWHRAMEDFRRRFPESRFRPELAEAKSDFLHAIRGDLLSLLTQLSDGLRDVPGFPGWRLFHSEVPQQLYERVMDTNPSGNPGPRFPVESLSWREARAFTERVSWILAAEAQLPPEDLFLAAAGRPGPQQLARQAWHSRNSERVPAPVATSTPNEDGFYDLYGNVDEWLFSPHDPPGSVQTAGGSARDNILTLAEMPLGTHSPDDRSRFIGFRFAVNLFPDPQ